ncbi:glycolipid 2-alpha-mannosyltransferase-domain-containing protein [Scheffersomyces xylosifermentans]|uniref:glycolipid 2-alpha-mannosyltransferase-domain-containing protein n=1 Tax=Scheffersomyces xylosifermentans TaxID=1304137 RepID=UPI00315DD4A1
MSERIIASGIDGPFQIGCAVPNPSQPRASAAFVMLSRNSELDGVLKSMASMERHFNQWYNYPWVFLNDEEFTDEFKETVKKHTSAEVEFGTIPKKEWDFDESIDQEEFGESIHSQGDRTILYGNLASYHKMCRFYSGFFYKHELVQKRDWYWRVEPDVEFYCDITYDPFIEMEKRRKKYGFTVIIGELYYTVPGLFRETRAFIKKSQLQLRNAWNLFISDSKFTRGGNAADYEGLHDPRDILREIEDNLSIKKFLKLNKKNEKHVSEFNPRLLNKLAEKSKTLPILHEDRMDREDYNLCHFWSNFEIARTDIFNSPLYEAYFEHLDKSGGFYKERWGDAPVHSLAVGMLLDLNEIHYFRDIGYRHANFAHCPRNSEKNQLRYKPSETYFRLNDLDQDKRWLRPDIPQKNGIGCRCRCPDNHKEIENASCLKDWVDKTAQNYKPLQPLDTDYYRIIIDERIDEYLANGGQLGYSNIADSLLNEGLVR